MRKSTYDKIYDILTKGKYDIEALYEIGLPLDFSERTGIEPHTFHEFYTMYKNGSQQDSNDTENDVNDFSINPETYTWATSSSRFNTITSDYIDSLINRLSTTQATIREAAYTNQSATTASSWYSTSDILI